MASKSEPFAALPRRVFEALEAYELNFVDVVLLAYLINRSAGTGRTSAKIATIKAQTRWPHSEEHLRKALHRLRDLGWISLEAPTKGGHSPWSFGLLGAEITQVELEVSSNSPRSERDPGVVETLGSSSNEAPTVGGPKDVDEDVEDDDAFKKALDALGLSATQRVRWLHNRALAQAWLAQSEAQAGITNRAAWIDARIQAGHFPETQTAAPNGRKGARSLELVLRDWVRLEGFEYPEDALFDEIDKRERKRGVELAPGEREALIQYWREQRERAVAA